MVKKYIVAEIGVNWDGDLELAKEMMKNAQRIGCDAVKFQAFNETIIKNHPERSRLIKCAVSQENVERIDNLSKTIGIEWFCTPMYLDSIEFLNPFVKKYKIREIDGRPLLQDKISPLIQKVLDTGKEVFISSQNSPRKSKYYMNPQIKWLYCVPKYPCTLNDLDFKNIKDFHGFSNHCPDINGAIRAAKLGAQIIEIHITADKSQNFLDNMISFDYSQLDELVERVRLSEE